MPTPMAQLDDRALVQMALAGQSECFGEIVHRHMKVVRARVVSIVRNSADVDDVVQEGVLQGMVGPPYIPGGCQRAHLARQHCHQ